MEHTEVITDKQSDSPGVSKKKTFSFLNKIFSFFYGNTPAIIGGSILLFIIVMSIFAPVLTEYDPEKRVGRPHEAPSAEHLLGTTRSGRDVFSQAVYGGQISLIVAFTAGTIAMVIAVILGMSAGYFGGKVDEWINFITNVVLVFPQVPLLIVLAAFLGQVGPVVISLLIGLTAWPWGTRIIRAQTLSLRNKEFVLAVEIMGESKWRIILFEILPNQISIVGGGLIGVVLYALLSQAGLEFLGLGDPTKVTWGTMLYWAQNNSSLYTGAWWDVFTPACIIALFGGALALINMSIDQISNPKLKTGSHLKKYKKLFNEIKAARAKKSPAESAKTVSGDFYEPEKATSPNQIKPLLKISRLCVDYIAKNGTARAVNNFSLDIFPGETIGLAGESGCGKSTLAFAICSLHKSPALISSGEINFNGIDVLKLKNDELRQFRWKEVSMVFQSAMNSLNPVITIGEQMADVILAHEKISQKEALSKSGDLLKIVGIHPDRLKSFPHQLSGGMRQRVAISIALALKPKLIVMDEPTTALDVVVEREIIDELNELKKAFGFSILFISHDLSLMGEISDRIGIMYAGNLVALGKTEEIMQHPIHPYTKGLLASFPHIKGPKTRLKGIPGNPPNLLDTPTGCYFQDRCENCIQECRENQPELRLINGRMVSCFAPFTPYNKS